MSTTENTAGFGRKLIIYIAASLDGYIAMPNDNLDFLSIVQHPGEDYGYQAFIDTVDTVIVGRKTYDWVMKQVPVFPHANKKTYIITRTERPAAGSINFYSGDLVQLVSELKARPGKNIFCDGGAEVIHTLLQEKLVDELIISYIPVLVGNGTKLFKDDRPLQKLKLLSVKQFEKGLVQVHYCTAEK